MDEFLYLTIHHSGVFVDSDNTNYKGGETATLKIDVDTWSYFEFVDVLKDLGYRELKRIWYRDLTFGMTELVDDKGALDIADLYRVHLRVDIYIQHTVCEPEFCEYPIEEDIVNEEEEELL